MYSAWHGLLDMGGSALAAKVRPYIGTTTSWFVGQAQHIGKLLVYCGSMPLFSALLYWRGEQVYLWFPPLRHRASRPGNAATPRCCWPARPCAPWRWAWWSLPLTQAVLGGIAFAVSGVLYAALLTVVMIFTCLVQLGPLLVLVPSIIWLYWSGDTTWGTVLLVWSCVVGTMDNVIRPVLIRMGADLPMILILTGVIGGLIAFGMIGLFIGPVLLAVSWRLYDAWAHGVPPPPKDPDVVLLEELRELEVGRK
ncbi:AI-2E family transporter YdiK [Klebsiella pneumoniae]|nr:AI-2E family transporter YdiK [Klebsiella pneumoniae]